MNIIKKLISFFLSIILFILILMFSFNIIIKRVVQKQIIGGVTKNQVISEYIDNTDSKYKEEIKDLINDKEAKEISDRIIDEYMEYINNNEYTVSEETIDKIINYCVKHHKEINKITEEEITIEKIKSPETREDLIKTINDDFKELKQDFGQTPTRIIKIYTKLISNNLQTALFISIIIVIILLMIVQNSFYKWISKLGVSLIFTSLFITSFYLIIILVINKINESTKIEIDINTREMLLIAIMEVIVGITLIIIKKITDKKEKYMYIEQNEIIEEKKDIE